MNEILIRTATMNDLDTLYQFEQGIINAERPFDISLQSGHIHYYDIKEMITAPHIEIVVAELNEEIIACGYARIEKSKPYFNHQQHAYLGFMYVLPEHRGKGVNQKIMDVLKTWAKKQNVLELRLQVYNDNTSAIHAYEKIGFSKNMIEMRMRLDGD
jgi:ribosomal protein S18 acetylase RimI-like enzyme